MFLIFILGIVVGVCLGMVMLGLLATNTICELREIEDKYNRVIRYARQHNGIVHEALYNDRSVG